MAKNILNKLLIVVLVLGFSIAAPAQKLSISEDKNVVVYEAVNDIKVRESPPVKGYVFVGDPGKEIATIKKGEQVVISEKRVISTAFSKTIWVKVRRVDSKVEGWVYWGEDEDKSVNFKLK